MRRPVPTLVLLAALPWLGACATASAPSSPSAGSPAAAAAPNESAVHWIRDAAERRALSLQTYGLASERLRTLAAGRPEGSWAVILDADETILDNSLYQKERLPAGGAFTADSWTAWVRREEATAVPGAVDFVALVRALGGRVAIVTNREERVCPETRRNIAALEMVADVVLCNAGDSDKDPRFDRVRTGTASPELPALDVLMWVGDNIEDFPGLDQGIRLGADDAFSAFGARYIVLPNPMYGSWQGNPAS